MGQFHKLIDAAAGSRAASALGCTECGCIGVDSTHMAAQIVKKSFSAILLYQHFNAQSVAAQ
eukprot:1157016-Pelagomonas_calceolata.AAC.11